MATTHNTPVRTSCRTAGEFKDDLSFAVAILAQWEQKLLEVKTEESLRVALVVRERAARIRQYIERTKLEGSAS